MRVRRARIAAFFDCVVILFTMLALGCHGEKHPPEDLPPVLLPALPRQPTIQLSRLGVNGPPSDAFGYAE